MSQGFTQHHLPYVHPNPSRSWRTILASPSFPLHTHIQSDTRSVVHTSVKIRRADTFQRKV